MNLDIRYPMGLLFSLLGLIIMVYGVFASEKSRSMDININLWWGMVLLVFGLIMLMLAKLGAAKAKAAAGKKPDQK